MVREGIIVWFKEIEWMFLQNLTLFLIFFPLVNILPTEVFNKESLIASSLNIARGTLLIAALVNQYDFCLFFSLFIQDSILNNQTIFVNTFNVPIVFFSMDNISGISYIVTPCCFVVFIYVIGYQYNCRGEIESSIYFRIFYILNNISLIVFVLPVCDLSICIYMVVNCYSNIYCIYLLFTHI
jgi:hypothetical protein